MANNSLLPPPVTTDDLLQWTRPLNTPSVPNASMAQNFTLPQVGGNSASPSTGWRDFLLGSYNADTGIQTPGAALPLLGVGNGLLQGYLGMKQYGLAKDMFEQEKRAFGAQYDAQRRLLNAELRDRQIARQRYNPDATPVDEYMRQNGVREL